MNKRVLWAVGFGGLMASATPAVAQGSEFRLDLRIVARSGDGSAGNPLVDLPGSMVLVPAGQTVRLELRYRITDVIPENAITARGLSTASINIRHDASATAGIMRRAELTSVQSGDEAPQPTSGAVNPDGSGLFSSPPSNTTGLINEFRGGLVTDDDLANGDPRDPATNVLMGTSFSIAPLGPSGGAVNPQRSDAAPGTQAWGLFAWTFTPALGIVGDVTFTASSVVDWDGNRFFYFRRDSGNSARVAGFEGLDANFVVRVIPAPGAAGFMLAAAGLFARRRPDLAGNAR